MQVFRTLRGDGSPLAITIGNFDGLHCGHRILIDELLKISRKRDLLPAVMTFEPHPAQFFHPEHPFPRLCSLRQKLELLNFWGVKRVYVCRFNSTFSRISAIDFARFLFEELEVQALLTGTDFRFGVGREGDLNMLSHYANQHFSEVIPVQDVNSSDNSRIASKHIRKALASGEFACAETLLGRPYLIHGRVMHGEKLGSHLGFPTINLSNQLNLPVEGVFAGWAHLENRNQIPAAISIGSRPTVRNSDLLCVEAHLLDFNEEIYAERVALRPVKKLHNQKRYAGFDELKKAISYDVAMTKKYLFAGKNNT